jgi:hypothetical protein
MEDRLRAIVQTFRAEVLEKHNKELTFAEAARELLPVIPEIAELDWI